MKSGARVALGVGVGYLLGRTKKMKLALMIAGAGATGSLGGLPRQVAEKLGSSPELSKITETARGELLTAARSAALAAVSSRIDSLSERLQERGGEPDAEEEPPDREEPSDQEEPPDQEEPEDEEEPEEEPEEKPAPARRRTARTGSTRTAVRRTRR